MKPTAWQPVLMGLSDVPSLLALPFLQSPHLTVPLIVLHTNNGDTRLSEYARMLLSESNPFFFKSKAGEGIGGPHVGVEMVGR